MRKNRLAQSGPWRKSIGGGSVIQEVVATRLASPNAAPLPSIEPAEEVSSGAALGGDDMRPGLVPALRDSRLEVQLDCTIISASAASLGQPVDVTLELSDDAGVSWVIVGEATPQAVLPRNRFESPSETNSQRFDILYRSSAPLLDAFPDYTSGEIIARATLVVANTSDSTLVSEGDPGNCRVTLREIAA